MTFPVLSIERGVKPAGFFYFAMKFGLAKRKATLCAARYTSRLPWGSVVISLAFLKKNSGRVKHFKSSNPPAFLATESLDFYPTFGRPNDMVPASDGNGLDLGHVF